jgi:hypothetical protein
LPELEVDMYGINDRNYEAQMNVFALVDDYHELEVDLCALNDRRCQAQLMCLSSMMIDWNLKWICVPSMTAATMFR